MWWRFWRRRSRSAPAEPELSPPAQPHLRPAARADEERDRGPAAAAFSGAAPGHVADLDAPGLAPPAAPAAREGAREAVVALVTAALAQDAERVAAVAGPLASRPADVEVAALTALAALGPRLLAAADVTADDALDGGLAAAAALAQADTLAARAEPLRALAPQVRPGLLRDAARHAVGGEVEDGAGADAEMLLLAAVLLLAQTCRDGQGSPDDLATELEALDG